MDGSCPFISGESHLEVNPAGWTHRVDARHRDRSPRVINLPDGPTPTPPRDGRWVSRPPTYGGKGREKWVPFGQSIDGTAGTGSCEQRVQEQDQDCVSSEISV